MTEEKMIPLSVIDAMIIRFKDITPSIETVFSQKDFIWAIVENLEKLKKEAIPSLEQKILQRIKKLEESLPDTYSLAEEHLQSDIRAIDELRKLLE